MNAALKGGAPPCGRNTVAPCPPGGGLKAGGRCGSGAAATPPATPRYRWKHASPGRAALFFAFFSLALFISPSADAQVNRALEYLRRGQNLMAAGDRIAALEAFLECININPAQAEAAASIAECYYELGEFDEALTWARRARSLSRTDMALANLEASTLIALGQIDAAQQIINQILAREPYNREALFSAAELEIARGRSSDALVRFREADRRFPDDRRVLVSLALVSASLGDNAAARRYIDQAMLAHPGDYLVYYFAAWLDSRANRVPEAIRRAEESLSIRPSYAPARSLLAVLRYRQGQYDEAARLADASIAANRDDTAAWHLKAMSLSRLGQPAEAITVLTTALSLNGGDEFVRAALEDLLINTTALEDSRRREWANWHFARARDYQSHNMAREALFEYRRGLRLNPYAGERRGYAELLRRQGYPSRYLEELQFMQGLGLEAFSAADRQAITDAIENYQVLLSESLQRRWTVEPRDLSPRHWKLAVFSLAGAADSRHVDSGAAAASLLREFIVHDRNMRSLDLDIIQPSFSSAFRAAREAGADYFLIISASENERDLSIKGDMYVGRTGSPAANFSAWRSGLDRLRNAARNLVEQTGAALPFRGELVRQRGVQGLVDKGRADNVQAGMIFDVVRRGRAALASEGISLVYRPEDITGTFTVNAVDEELAAGTLARSGFSDYIEPGDELFLRNPSGAASPPPSARPAAANAELQALLRSLR